MHCLTAPLLPPGPLCQAAYKVMITAYGAVGGLQTGIWIMFVYGEEMGQGGRKWGGGPRIGSCLCAHHSFIVWRGIA